LPIFIFAAILSVLILAGSFFIPWQHVKWGKLELLPSSTITVVGEARTQEKNQIATFTAGVNAVHDNKETVISEANKKIEDIISAVKKFGIQSEDIKTQNLSVYQQEETYYEEGRQKTRPGQWRVSNSIEIKLRNIDKALDLADLLSRSGATNVYGPNFSLDDTKGAETELIDKAMGDARKKAEAIAKSSGNNLGKVLNVAEGYQQVGIYPVALGAGRGGGGGIEPGTGTVQKVLTVTFELK